MYNRDVIAEVENCCYIFITSTHPKAERIVQTYKLNFAV